MDSLIESLHINLLDFMFINFSVFIIFAGALINLVEPYLPLFITQSFRYGKHESKGEKNAFVCLLEVPKAWFKHFYVFAFIWSASALYLTIKGISLKTTAPEFVLVALDWLGGSNRQVLLTSQETFIVMTLITTQCARRFYETNFVQIFSSTSKINISHYLVGYLHYFGAIVAILLNAEGFVRGKTIILYVVILKSLISRIPRKIFLNPKYEHGTSNLLFPVPLVLQRTIQLKYDLCELAQGYNWEASYRRTSYT